MLDITEILGVIVLGAILGAMFAIAVLGSGELARLLALLGGFQ